MVHQEILRKSPALFWLSSNCFGLLSCWTTRSPAFAHSNFYQWPAFAHSFVWSFLGMWPRELRLECWCCTSSGESPIYLHACGRLLGRRSQHFVFIYHQSLLSRSEAWWRKKSLNSRFQVYRLVKFRKISQYSSKNWNWHHKFRKFNFCVVLLQFAKFFSWRSQAIKESSAQLRCHRSRSSHSLDFQLWQHQRIIGSWALASSAATGYKECLCFCRLNTDIRCCWWVSALVCLQEQRWSHLLSTYSEPAFGLSDLQEAS